MKNKKNGFTLVELLSVIVILAVILVIAVPRIVDVIEYSRESAFLLSAKTIASSAEKKYIENKVLGINEPITCGDVIKYNEKDYEYCNISFENGEAIVVVGGKGKFEDMYSCGATKNNAVLTDSCATNNACFDFNIETGEILSYYNYEYNDPNGKECPKDVIIPAKMKYSFYKTSDEFGTGEVATNEMSTNEFGTAEYGTEDFETYEMEFDVTTIGDSAFYGMDINSVVLPNTLKITPMCLTIKYIGIIFPINPTTNDSK